MTARELGSSRNSQQSTGAQADARVMSVAVCGSIVNGDV
jgi:hypothetical protein